GALFGTRQDEGFALLAVAGAYAVASAVFFARTATRALSALLAAVAFVLGGWAIAELLSGNPLAYAWAAEAVALAWLARRATEPRFQPWSARHPVPCTRPRPPSPA